MIRMFSLALLLSACSDYNLKTTDNALPADDTAPTAPAASVDPASVDLGVVCGESAAEVSVTSTGTAPLTISSVSISGEGWSLGEVALPATLEPGGVLALPLTSTGDGDATLFVASDDPDHPTLSVPLSAVADAAPTISIDSPIDGDVLDVSAIISFSATVSDDVDALETLSVEWASDVDGPLGSASADAAGAVGLAWDASAVSSGSQTVTATVTDSCGNTASDTVSVCQNAGYLAENLDLGTWHFEGSALWDSTNSWVQLTDTGTGEAGTAFQTAETADASNVVIEFSFYVSGGSGADGISLTALDSSRMSSFVGASGGGMGFGGLPGWSLEVDTWWNSEYYEPSTEDHLSLDIDGNYTSPVVSAVLPEMEDGAWHTLSVTVAGTWMTVLVDGVTYINQDVPSLTSFPAYVGFTGGTGSYTNYHLIDALLVENYVCEG